MRILYAYPNFYSHSYEINSEVIENKYIEKIKKQGYDIEGFCLTLNPPNQALSWKQLDYYQKNGNSELTKMYDLLSKKLKDYDVLINAAGINLHPDFLKTLNNIKVFICNDDPENSKNLSTPVCHQYDLCLVGNIAEVNKYYQWGARKVIYHPIGFNSDLVNHNLTEEQILNINERPYKLVFVGDFNSRYRKQRLKELIKRYPWGQFFGYGSPNGFISNSQLVELYSKSQIGINIHNSTGPVNSRTFTIPSNGALLICDNPTNLNKIFEVGKEAVGFSSQQDLFNKIDYFIEHKNLQRNIALKGFRKAHKNYNEFILFEKLYTNLTELSKKNHQIKKNETNPIKSYSIYERKKSLIIYKLDALYKNYLHSFFNICRIIFTKIPKCLKFI